MKRTNSNLLILAAIAVLIAGPAFAEPVSHAFTYQGRFKDGGKPADGAYDFVFRLFDAEIGPAQLGDDLYFDAWLVVEGLFTAELDFGPEVFTGNALWLEVGVRPSGSTEDYVILSPRQSLTAAPFAVYALSGAGAGHWEADGDDVLNTNGGNVGIGVVSPAAKLHVQGQVRSSASGTGDVSIGDRSSNGLGVAVRMAELHLPPDPGEFFNADICYDGERLSLLTGERPTDPVPTNGLVIMNSGRVGIGTTLPGAQLTVAGMIESTTDGVKFPDGTVQTTAAGDSLWHLNGSNIYYNGGDVGIGTNTPVGQLALGAYQGGTSTSLVEGYDKQLVLSGEFNTGVNAGDAVKLMIADYDNDVGSDIYPIYVEDENNWVHFYLRSIGGIRRTYFGGDVGIGTNLPSNPLSVAGDADISGNLGIAAPYPDVRLHVQGGTDASLRDGGFLQLGPTTGENLVLDDNEIMTRNNGGLSNLHINRDGGNTIVNQFGGRVGVGVGTPAAKLDVHTTAGIGIQSSGADTGIDAEGSTQGGLFYDANNSGYAKVAYSDTGIFAEGDSAGAHFKDSNGSGDVYLAYTDDQGREWGIQAEGDKAGGWFFDADGSGEARIAYSNPDGTEYGVWGTSDGYGGSFFGKWGVNGYGDVQGGVFGCAADGWATLGFEDFKIFGNGRVSFVQNHPEDSDRVIVYTAPEGDETATYTRGTARLVNGEARVTLSETFEWVTNPDIGLTAHLTPREHAVPLAVVSLSTEELVVRGPVNCPEDLIFDYLVYGLRIGFEETSVVREKKREARIPSMASDRRRYKEEPELRRFTALERYKAMRAAVGRADPPDTNGARALRDAIAEFDPAIHRIEWPGMPDLDSLNRSRDNCGSDSPAVSGRSSSTRQAGESTASQNAEIEELRARIEVLEGVIGRLNETSYGGTR
jgi:hypothetical protein